MKDFVNLLWVCFYELSEEAREGFDDVESVDEGLELDFNAVFEGRD